MNYDCFIICEQIFNFIELDGSKFESYLDEMVATVDTGSRPRGTAYGWKSTLEKYGSIIEKVSKDLHAEIKLLGYET